MRSLWSGSLSFGLINIPVRLYSGSQHMQVDLDMLHKADLSPIRFAHICKLEEKEVPYKDIVKGYAYDEGEYIVLSDKDFEEITLERSSTIDIQLFTQETDIDTIYFEKPYFLEPGKGADKSYLLLRDALKKSGKVAVAKYIFRNRVHIGVIKVFGEILILNQLRFDSELRDREEIKLPAAKKSEAKEISLAIKFIEQLTAPFNPKDYVDTYIEDLKAVIEQKMKGAKKTLKKKKEKMEKTKTGDLLSKLKASLEQRNPKPGISRTR